MKRILFVLLAAVGLLASSADLASLRREADASQNAVTSPGAPCNRGGGETFAEFLVRFTVEPAFHSERSKVSQVFALRAIKDYRALVVNQGHESGYNQRWQVAGPDKVLLVCGYADAPADYSYVFQRNDGVWYLTDRIVDDF